MNNKNSNLADKMAGLDKAFGWQLHKTEINTFYITIQTRDKLNDAIGHTIKTQTYKNVSDVFDEAIEIFQEHLNDCPIC